MSISLHTGNPRTGKTYGMHKTILRCLNQGIEVWANYKINWEGYEGKKWSWKKFKFIKVKYPKENLKYWKSLDDIYKVEKGVIAMDEAHVYINSRRWADMPEEFERKIAQHGKEGLHIIGTVQNLRRLDTVMRELTDYWYLYKVFPGVPKDPWKKHKPLFFLKYRVLMETDISPRRVMSPPHVYFFRKKIARTYDSFAKVVK